MEYLQNYLSVLPDYDRKQVEQLVKENMDLFDVQVITKEEFESLLQQLANRKDKVTTLKPTEEKVDADHFNTMHSNVHLDLRRLYHSHLIVEKVMANYDRILKGSLDDINREVNALASRVEELNLKAKGEDGLIVKTYGFDENEKNLHMETDREKYAHLFTDRDNRTISNGSLNRNYHQHYLSLPIHEISNALHDQNGKTTAKIKVESSAGITNLINDAIHPPEHAIDDSLQTYWAEAVTFSAPAHTSMKKLTK
ncbi:hypothetical protein AAAC51_07500 [Priestia megaterium]